jgi:hypothetical protein
MWPGLAVTIWASQFVLRTYLVMSGRGPARAAFAVAHNAGPRGGAA